METERNKRRRWLWLVIPAVLLAAAAVFFGARYQLLRRGAIARTEVPPGTWVELSPEGIVSANGEPVYSEMRVGVENKVMVFFHGGGLSVNEYTAQRPYIGARFFADEIGFYTADIYDSIPDYLESGLTGTNPRNPFRDWTVIVIPYATGDFHLGTADYEFTDMDGRPEVLHHHGYTNFRALMDEAMLYVDDAPEELLVVGWSAGGFAAAALAGELREDYFPGAEHTTVCVDSSLLLWERFPETAYMVWGVPEPIASRFQSEDLLTDLLTSLYDAYGDSMTYLYIGSVRDGALARYQNFLNFGVFAVTNAQGQLFRMELRDTLFRLRQRIPTLGVYLFDSLPFSLYPSQFFLTQHTVLGTQTAFSPLTDWTRPASWLMDAVQGRVTDRGLGMLR